MRRLVALLAISSVFAAGCIQAPTAATVPANNFQLDGHLFRLGIESPCTAGMTCYGFFFVIWNNSTTPIDCRHCQWRGTMEDGSTTTGYDYFTTPLSGCSRMRDDAVVRVPLGHALRTVQLWRAETNTVLWEGPYAEGRASFESPSCGAKTCGPTADTSGNQRDCAPAISFSRSDATNKPGGTLTVVSVQGGQVRWSEVAISPTGCQVPTSEYVTAGNVVSCDNDGPFDIAVRGSHLYTAAFHT